MSTKTLITADELEQMPDDDSVQIELDEGELIITLLASTIARITSLGQMQVTVSSAGELMYSGTK